MREAETRKTLNCLNVFSQARKGRLEAGYCPPSDLQKGPAGGSPPLNSYDER